MRSVAEYEKVLVEAATHAIKTEAAGPYRSPDIAALYEARAVVAALVPLMQADAIARIRIMIRLSTEGGVVPEDSAELLLAAVDRMYGGVPS